ncbi:lysozyme [Paraburkholderia youngii]|uniref:Lysozyme n=1 Tax=Paraburkholderia youngii TaxID=2782701 RepID=A0A7Y6MXB0_9BURK|nr:lysozyme [Paraburkholderia youngii]NUX99551.1 lysozyme [Paraburkholderia youngii]
MPDAIGSALTDTNPHSCVDLRCDRHGKPWTVTENLIQFTAQWEAFRAHLYDNDGGGRGGNTTIGYGHLVHMGPINGSASETPWLAGVTVPQAFALIREDIKVAERIINQRILLPLYQYEYDSLVDFVYNVRGHTKESLLKLVNTGHYDRVPAKFLEYTSASGAHPGGLLKRRHAEAKMFRDGIYDASH